MQNASEIGAGSGHVAPIVGDVVAAPVVDGLFRYALARRMTPALRSRLLSAGLDVEAKSSEAVPRQSFAAWLKLTVESLFSGVSESEAYRELGRDLVRGYSMTLFGSAVIAVARVIGPRRTLERMARNSSSIAASYRARIDADDESRVKFWVSEAELPPTFMAGVLSEAATLAGGRDVLAEPLRVECGGWLYSVRWVA